MSADNMSAGLNPMYLRRKRWDIIIRALCFAAAAVGVTWLALILITLPVAAAPSCSCRFPTDQPERTALGLQYSTRRTL